MQSISLLLIFLICIKSSNQRAISEINYENEEGPSADTGTINNETLTPMNRPRCGIPNRSPAGTAAAISRWTYNNLTYKIQNKPAHISQSEIDDVMRKSTKRWTDIANLTISETDSDDADILMSFKPGDGPGQTLAYAYFPENGDIVFDSLENWAPNSSNGYDLNWVAIHELGHSLGLGHSEDSKSVMYPFYYPTTPIITKGDRKNIANLYGRAIRADDIPFCENQSVDAVLKMNEEVLFVQGNSYAKVTSTGRIQRGLLSSMYKNFPGNVDAGVQLKKITYFFKNNVFYKYQNNGDKNYIKKLISKGFVGIPDAIDAVFYDGDSNKIYFFKGHLYYIVEYYTVDNSSKSARLSVSGQKISDDWNGLPNDVEAAYYFGDNTAVFIKAGMVYAAKLNNFKVVRGYPKSILSDVFECNSWDK